MKIRSSKALSVIVGALLCAGCAVKEYRESCPCRLVLDFSEVDTSAVRSADLYVTVPDGYVFTDYIGSEKFARDYTAIVPRTVLQVNLMWGAGGFMSESGLSIPKGEDCPPVYMHSSTVNADCEMWRETVWMRKNHCRVDIDVNADEGYRPWLKIVSDVCGYDVYGKPVEGYFESRKRVDEEYSCSFTLPRQTDDLMTLEIDEGDGILKRFSLGEYIASTGYDWNTPDLQDIQIELDFAVTQVVLKISGWDGEHKFDIVI